MIHAGNMIPPGVHNLFFPPSPSSSSTYSSNVGVLWEGAHPAVHPNNMLYH